jgi:large conductance mechanosensitive channel
MQRFREMLAHGGIAVLAVVFALAFAAFALADAVAEVAVVALQQHVIDAETGGALAFSIAGTDIDYTRSLQGALSVLLIAGAFFALWRLARSAVRTCPECCSDVPRPASVCRYCTAELPEVTP